MNTTTDMNTTTEPERKAWEGAVGRPVHPADAYGKKDPTKIPITSILRSLDRELSPPTAEAERAELEAYIRPRLRADNRLEEISRLLLSLPFGEMLKLAQEMVEAAPTLEEGMDLPKNIQMAMSLDTWAKKKMEERDAPLRETPTAK